MFKFKIERSDMGAVAGKIQEAGTWIKTPIRVLNSRELTHGEKVMNGAISMQEFPHPIYEIPRHFRKNTILSFIKNHEVSYKIQKQVEKDSSKGGNRITLFHPSFDKDFEVTDEINAKLIEMQLQCNIDGVSIWDNNKSSHESWDKRLNKSINLVEDSALEPMPTLNMGMDDIVFKKKLDVVKDHKTVLLNVAYAPIKKFYRNYLHLIKLVENNDIWVHMSEVDRYWRGNYQSSMMHIAPFLGVSSVTVKSKPLGFGLFKRVPKPAKRFDGRCLGHITSKEHNQRYGKDLGCDCFVDEGRDLDGFYNNFSGSELLNSALVCHEVNGSLDEFSNFRKSILQSDCMNYVKEKEFMKSPFKKIFKIDFDNRTLN